MGIVRCRTGARRCLDFSADSSPTSVKKRKIFSFSVGNAVAQKKRLYTATLAHLLKKMDLRLAAIRKRSYKTGIVLEMLLSSLKSFLGKIYRKDVHSHRKSIKTILKRCNYSFMYFQIILQFFLTKIDLIIICSYNISYL